MNVVGSPPARGRAGERGFTLIELLIAVVVLGILISISVQGLNGFRQRAFNAAVKTDLRNAMAAQEGYFADRGIYAAFELKDGGSIEDPAFTASQQVTIVATQVGSGVRIEGSHSASPASWCISTVTGRVVEGTGC